MDEAADSAPADTASPEPESHSQSGKTLLRWAVVVSVALGVFLLPVPAGITPQSWRLLAIFVATITGSILRPVPGGAMVLLGVSALAISGAMPVASALGGYADQSFGWCWRRSLFRAR